MPPIFVACVAMVASVVLGAAGERYQPNWKSLDARPLPSWYDEAKFGIMVNWGLYSVPSFGSEWFWWSWKGAKDKATIKFMQDNYAPGFTYADFAPKFKAEFYDPVEWTRIFQSSGAKYVVFSSKHHEGFTTWPSKVSWNWNAQDLGPRRDLLGGLADAIGNNSKLHFGVYHSLFEWFNPIYLIDKSNEFATQEYVKRKTMPELFEIVEKYKPEVVWSDGDWEAPDTYWNSTEFLAWLYNDSPVKDTVVTNDRWGSGISCHHGGFFTCSDRFNPGILQKHKWENCMTIDRTSWGYRRNAQIKDFLAIEQLIGQLVETVSCGGNLLMNVAPTPEGTIVPIFQERLRQMGEWLQVNGEAIYSSKPWTHQNDTVTPGVWYTSQKNLIGTRVYAIALKWPKGNTLELAAISSSSPSTTVTLLGYSGQLTWSKRPAGGMLVHIPPIAADQMPCQWAWTFRLDHMALPHHRRSDNALL